VAATPVQIRQAQEALLHLLWAIQKTLVALVALVTPLQDITVEEVAVGLARLVRVQLVEMHLTQLLTEAAEVAALQMVVVLVVLAQIRLAVLAEVLLGVLVVLGLPLYLRLQRVQMVAGVEEDLDQHLVRLTILQFFRLKTVFIT